MPWITEKDLNKLIKLNPKIKLLKQIKKDGYDSEVMLYIVPCGWENKKAINQVD